MTSPQRTQSWTLAVIAAFVVFGSIMATCSGTPPVNPPPITTN